MTIINLTLLDRAKIVGLATNTKKQLTIQPIGTYHRYVAGQRVELEAFVTDSIDKEHMHFHDVEVWQLAGHWYAECDSTKADDDEFACKANKLGARLCSHVARCVMLLEDQGKLRLSFIGQCDLCNREKVRVYFDGVAYCCTDVERCRAAQAERDRKDIFGDAGNNQTTDAREQPVVRPDNAGSGEDATGAEAG